eukprot:2426015-Alexandrium_andersonii.AAC.1
MFSPHKLAHSNRGATLRTLPTRLRPDVGPGTSSAQVSGWRQHLWASQRRSFVTVAFPGLQCVAGPR